MKISILITSFIIISSCSAQKKFFVGDRVTFSGTFKILKEKDEIFNEVRPYYYLFLDSPVELIDSADGSHDTTTNITKISLLLEPDNLSFNEYNNQKVKLVGLFETTPTMHYHSYTMLTEVTVITPKKSITSIDKRFYIGDKLTPTASNFKLLGFSTQTNVYSYQYLGNLIDEYFYGRQIADIVVGIKNGIIVTTIYNLLPEKNDVGVPTMIIEQIQKTLPFPLSYKNNIYGVNIDNTSISISRTNNIMTFNKDRIMIFTSVKQSILSQ